MNDREPCNYWMQQQMEEDEDAEVIETLTDRGQDETIRESDD